MPSRTFRWTPTAVRDLEHAADYLLAQGGQADAYAILQAALAAILRTPQVGRPGRVKKTRELPLPNLPLKLVYRPTREAIQVLGVVHEALAWE